VKRAYRLPFGAESGHSGVRFRLWAPAAQSAAVAIDADEMGTTHGNAGEPFAMHRVAEGWFELVVSSARAGSRYRYVVDGAPAVPDPASRFQPLGVHGPSEVIDPAAFAWSAAPYERPAPTAFVFYELHVGAFTPQGTFRAAIERLDALRDLGVTAIELMPVAQGPGERGWGYDGAYPFAPSCTYGRPDDMKTFVDAAHARGIAVFLDVVYNHFGPEGNYLGQYAPQFFTARHTTPWGSSIDFSVRPVREFFIHNALYWAHEFAIDGLRLDAVHAIFDDTQPGFLVELAERFAAGGNAVAGGRACAVLENDENRVSLLRYYDAQWDDDVHHALHVLLTGECDGYYADYCERPAALLARALAEGFAFQGDVSAFRDNTPRGEPSAALAPEQFVTFLQNHDQIGNRAYGDRIAALAPENAVRAAAALLLLAPSPPLLFMGEEWAASAPFLYFCDLEPALAARVRDGRRGEFARFARYAADEARERIPDPTAEPTFVRSKLAWAERAEGTHAAMLALYSALLRTRREAIVPLLARGRSASSYEWDASAPHALRVRWTFGAGTLALTAQLAGEPARPPWLADAVPGNELFAVRDGDAADAHTLPPWSVSWTLQT
jgi:maltooligosyltrehalose trehalohydrolase